MSVRIDPDHLADTIASSYINSIVGKLANDINLESIDKPKLVSDLFDLTDLYRMIYNTVYSKTYEENMPIPPKPKL